MDLINKKLLQSRLRNYSLPDDMRLSKIREVIESYQTSIGSGNLDKTKEVSIQGQFLQHFFEEILGYSFSQRTPTHWTLEHEGTIQGGSADGILGFFTPSSRSIRAVIELKDAKTDLDKNRIEPLTKVR